MAKLFKPMCRSHQAV